MSTIAELENRCLDLRKELSMLKMQLALGQLKDTSKIKKLKKDIARIKTTIYVKKGDANG